MGGLFSSGKKKDKGKKQGESKFSEKDRAILELKRQRDRLKKYTIKCENVVARETAIAMELLRQGKKARAKLALRKKKYQLNMISKTEGQMMNLEELVNSIEFSTMQNEVFKALETGKDTLQMINSQISLDDVEKLMQDTDEAVSFQEELAELLGAELTQADDDAVLEELEALEAEELKTALPDAPTTAVTAPPRTTVAATATSTATTTAAAAAAPQKKPAAATARTRGPVVLA